MRYLVAVVTLLLGCLPISAGERAPNIVVILADDLGWFDVGFSVKLLLMVAVGGFADVWGVLFGEEIDCSRREKAIAIEEAGFALDYFEARHAETLLRVEHLREGPIRLLAAARLGSTLDQIPCHSVGDAGEA